MIILKMMKIVMTMSQCILRTITIQGKKIAIKAFLMSVMNEANVNTTYNHTEFIGDSNMIKVTDDSTAIHKSDKVSAEYFLGKGNYNEDINRSSIFENEVSTEIISDSNSEVY